MSEKNNKWKNALLKTGLPLEYLISEKLSDKGFGIGGEFSYIRKNEQNINTEFSVDLNGFKLIKKGKDDYWADLMFLIECKYNYPGVKWVFTPHSKESFITSGIVNTFDNLCTSKVENTKFINSLDDNLYYCVKGVELHELDSNVQSITRGLYQLKYAVPQLAKRTLQTQITTWNDEDLNIGFICPILVTTASLFVFNERLNLTEIEKAKNLSEIAEEVDALVVHQENTPQLDDYIRELTRKLYSDFPEIIERLESAAKIQGKPISNFLPESFGLNHRIKHSAENVLVVTYNYFEKMVSKIHNAVQKSGKSLKQFATLKKDMTKRRSWIEPISAPPKAK